MTTMTTTTTVTPNPWVNKSTTGGTYGTSSAHKDEGSRTDEGAYLLKIVMIGDSGVGKTSLLLRYTEDCFTETFIATIGVDFKIKTLHDVCGCTAKLQIWDTAGQDRFKTIVSSFYRGAHGLAIVFDLTDMSSFQNVKGWLDEARLYGSPENSTLLIGNKADLTAKRVVDREEAKVLADRLGLIYVETSARDSTNVTHAFDSMARCIVERKKERGDPLQQLLQLSGGNRVAGQVDIGGSSRREVGQGCFGTISCALT